MTDKIVVLVTCGQREEATRIGRALVEERLAACVNIMSAPVESIYRWKGKVETAKETLMIIKSSRGQWARLVSKIRSLHGYEVPEIIALPIGSGLPAYLQWIEDNVGKALSRQRVQEEQELRRPKKRERRSA